MNEPDEATQQLFDKLNEIRSDLSPDSLNLLRTILNIAGDIEEVSVAAADPVAFEAEFDEAFTPYSKSKAELMRKYDTLPQLPASSVDSIIRSIIRSSGAGMSIIQTGVFATPPLVVNVDADESDDNAEDD